MITVITSQWQKVQDKCVGVKSRKQTGQGKKQKEGTSPQQNAIGQLHC